MQILDEIEKSSNSVRERHGCVTAYLAFMVIVNAITSLVYIFLGEVIVESSRVPISSFTFAVLMIVSLSNIAFALSLLKWKKWGFYGSIVSSIIGLLINTNLELPLEQTVLGLLGVGILFAILQIKQNGKSAWEHME